MPESQRSRVVAAAELVGFALQRDLPHIALGAAREAARSALLALAAAPRRLSGPDIELLREVAAAPPQHLSGRPAERLAGRYWTDRDSKGELEFTHRHNGLADDFQQASGYFA